jgi:hypothetical protein
VTEAAFEHLRHADLWALVLELIVFAIFLISLGGLLLPVMQTWHGKLLVIGTLVLGLILPLILHVPFGSRGLASTASAAVLSLIGGFVLRYAMLTTPPELLARSAELRAHYTVAGRQGFGTPGPALLPRFSPEDGRPRGGGPGAGPGNETNRQPRSKVFHGP